VARIRSIKPEFPQSESMGRVSRDARLLFVMLWPICDDHGRTRAASRMLASLLFPYDNDAPKLIGGWLDELEREKCIRRYESDGSTFLIVCNWLKHQKIDKPSKPQFPEPSIPFERIREDSSEEGKGVEGIGEDKSSCAAPVSQSPAVLTILTNTGFDFPITEDHVAEFKANYPAADVMQELRAMRAWAFSNSSKRKTKSGMLRFVNGWLSKAQNNPKFRSTANGAMPEYMVGAL